VEDGFCANGEDGIPTRDDCGWSFLILFVVSMGVSWVRGASGSTTNGASLTYLLRVKAGASVQ